MSKMVKQKSPAAAAKVMIAYKIVWDLFCLIVINNPPKFAVIRSLVYYIIKHRIFQGQGSQVYVNNGKKAEVTRRGDSEPRPIHRRGRRPRRPVIEKC